MRRRQTMMGRVSRVGLPMRMVADKVAGAVREGDVGVGRARGVARTRVAHRVPTCVQS